MNRHALASLALCFVSLTSIAALKSDTSRIELRFVPANEAYTALKEHLGGDGAAIVKSVDPRKNTLTLDSNHALSGKAREFLASLDVRPAQMVVHAVITRKFDATPTEGAREVILSRPTAVVKEGSRLVFNTPSEGGSINIELRINSVPAQK